MDSLVGFLFIFTILRQTSSLSECTVLQLWFVHQWNGQSGEYHKWSNNRGQNYRVHRPKKYDTSILYRQRFKLWLRNMKLPNCAIFGKFHSTELEFSLRREYESFAKVVWWSSPFDCRVKARPKTPHLLDQSMSNWE